MNFLEILLNAFYVICVLTVMVMMARIIFVYSAPSPEQVKNKKNHDELERKVISLVEKALSTDNIQISIEDRGSICKLWITSTRDRAKLASLSDSDAIFISKEIHDKVSQMLTEHKINASLARINNSRNNTGNTSESVTLDKRA